MKSVAKTEEEQREELAERIDSTMRRVIASWSDLYALLDVTFKMFMATPDPVNAGFCIIWHRAFAKALQNLPEEGDALKVGQEMARVLLKDIHQELSAATASNLLKSSTLDAVEASVFGEKVAREEAKTGKKPLKTTVH